MENGDKLDCDKRNRLIEVLSTKLLESELIWNLFCSTCDDYKIDSLLRPFPKMFLDSSGDKMIQKLRHVISTVNKLEDVLKELQVGNVNPDVYNLLKWILCNEAFQFKAVPKGNFAQVLKKVQPVEQISAHPQYIFEVDSQSKGRYQRFKAFADQYGSQFAFHGSRLENYFSILHHGLQISMNKIAVFGPGIYLSSDLSVSLLFSPSGIGSRAAKFGTTFAVVALCEVVDHPDVKCQHDKDFDRQFATNDRRYLKVPNKYIIVQNSDMVQVRYLLVYTGFGQSAIQKRLSSLPAKKTIIILIIIFIFINNFKFLSKILQKVLYK